MFSKPFSSLTVLLVATPCYILCSISHTCMCGHLQHPPYEWWDYAADLVWITGYATLSVGLLRMKVRSVNIPCVFLAVLMFSRLCLGSLGGLLFVIEFPMLLYLIGWAVLRIARSYLRSHCDSNDAMNRDRR